jgi:phospholipid/cholesterol/gamma-HCH transport system substrate-binding protein
VNLTKAQKVRLGVFIASGAALFFGSLLTLAGLKAWEKRDVYTVRFSDSVSGLEKSAQVRYQGLRVGRVEAMKVAEDDPSAIEVTLSLDPKTKLYEGTTAVLDVSGITGLKTINLTPGDARRKLLEPGSLLPAGKSFVDRITGEAESITIKAELVANQLAKWTADENRLRFERLLEASAKLTEDLDRLIVDARKPAIATLEEATRSGAAIRGVSVEATALMHDLGPDLKTAVAEAKGAIAEANRILKAVDSKAVANTVHSAEAAMTSLDKRVSAAEFGKTIADLQTTLSSLAKLLSEVDLAVRASRDDFVNSLAHVRQATEDLREFSRIIAQDPSALIRGKEVEE